MASELFCEQELEDFALIVSNEAIEKWSNFAGEGIDQAVSCANTLMDLWVPNVGYCGESGNRYRPSTSDDRKLLIRVQLRIGNYHIQAHDGIYYLLYVCSHVVLHEVFKLNIVGDMIADAISERWGNHASLIRIEDDDLPIFAASIKLACGNPFGLSVNGKTSSFTLRQVTEELENAGYFLTGGQDFNSFNTTVRFPESLFGTCSDVCAVTSFERCPIVVSEARRDEYVECSFSRMTDLGVFKTEDGVNYTYCA